MIRGYMEMESWAQQEHKQRQQKHLQWASANKNAGQGNEGSEWGSLGVDGWLSLLDNGALTQDEYDAKKSDLLARI